MLALPTRDEAAIALALESLEQKLASWMSAMSELQVFLKARGVRTKLTEQPAPITTGLLVKDRADAPPPPAFELEPRASAAANESEEEALLATLDTETANWIRVKRRLGGNRRSVRELLDEFRAQRGAQPDKKRTRR
jgi:hypothetical protein